MANVKITQLPLATTPLTGTEDIPLVQGTTTKQVTVTGLFTSPVMTNPTLGTVGQADLINATGLPISTGVAGLGTGIATFLGTPSSTNLRAAVTDETGTGSLVFATSPTLVTPNLGTPSVLVATNATGTAVGLTAGSAITNANLTGAVTSVGNATSLGSFTSAQLRTALTDETGAGSAVFATSPTITAPILNQINDTNNAQILGLSPTTSAVDYLVAKNGIGVGVPLHLYADGASANIGLHIQPKGTGLVTISDGTDFNKGIRFRSSGSAASAVTLLDAVSTAGRVVTLPDATTTLVGRDTTDTLTNKTIAFSSNTFSGTLAIANGGTNASTAASAIENLLPAYTGNGSKALKLNSGATALEWIADGGGTVTSVAASVPSFLSIAGSPITTSGTLAFTLSGTALPTTSGGTGLTLFTSGGVVYASSTSALATGSGLTYNGTGLNVTGTQSANLFSINASGGGDSFSVTALSSGGGAVLAALNSTYADYTPLRSIAQFHQWDVRNGVGTSSEQMRLTSSSLYTAIGINVGIGLSNPVFKLDVDSGATAKTANFSSTATTAYSPTSSGVVTNCRVTLSGGNATDSYSAIRFNGQGGNFENFFGAVQNSAGNGQFVWGGFNGSAYGEWMRLSSASNLGLGVAPSAWVNGKALQVGGGRGGSFFVEEVNYGFASLNANCYHSATDTWRYVSSNPASRYNQLNSVHSWYTSASGTAGDAISFTQAMTLDASGNLGVGTTSPLGRFSIAGGESNFTGLSTVSGTSRVNIGADATNTFVRSYDSSGGFIIGTYNATPLKLLVNAYEAARIDTSGNLLVGATAINGAERLNVTKDVAAQEIVRFIPSHATDPYGLGIIYTNANPNGSSNEFIGCYSSGATKRMAVLSNGGIANYSANNVNLSDRREKTNFAPAKSYLETICAIPVQTFNYIDQNLEEDGGLTLGVVAQDVQSIAPELVMESNWGNKEDPKMRLSIYQTDLQYALMKCIQEQQTMIESLKARLDAANL
jgi:hypothetical protein